MVESVDLLIFPTAQAEEDIDEVKARLIETLKVGKAKVDGWYSADTPSMILRGVDEKVADRYVKAITRCGARCTTSPHEAEKNPNLFICPTCQYEQEIQSADEIDQCPKCGLVIAKWQAQMTEEAEKEKFRRRLQQAARLLDPDPEELDPQSSGMVHSIFKKFPIALGIGIGSLVVIASGFIFYSVDEHLEQEKLQELVDNRPYDEKQELALIVGAAALLQQTGNEAVVEEFAVITQLMRGRDGKARASVVEAARQMIEGAGPANFVDLASRKFDKPAGRAGGLTGVVKFNQKTLSAIYPSKYPTGHDELLLVLAEKRLVRNRNNPDGPAKLVDAIEEMDGSAILDLLNSLAMDLEWDQFLAVQVRQYLKGQELERALELTSRIKNPVIKIASLGEIMSGQFVERDQAGIKADMAKVLLLLDNIPDPDLKAKSWLAVNDSSAVSGSVLENMVSPGLYERSLLHARLAVNYWEQGDERKSRLHFGHASRDAGQIREPENRISAFVRIAQRYFDVRNTTLANEILNQAALLAVQQLDTKLQARIFGEVAIARGYMGDFVGAIMAIDDAGRGEAKQQLISKLAEMLIDNERYFQAMEIMGSLQNNVEHTRLGIRLIGFLVHSDRHKEAEFLLALVMPGAQGITEPASRGLMLSQLARLLARGGYTTQSEALFNEALAISDGLKGKKSQLLRGLVALDRARLFQFEQSRELMEIVSDIVVKDPISNEIAATQRMAKLLFPEFLEVKP